MAKPMTFKQKAALKIAQAKSAAKRKGKKLKVTVGKAVTTVKKNTNSTSRLRAKLKVKRSIKKAVSGSGTVRTVKAAKAGVKAGTAAGKRGFEGKASASEKRNKRIAKSRFKSAGKGGKAAIIGATVGAAAASYGKKTVTKMASAYKTGRKTKKVFAKLRKFKRSKR